ncbi:hypothetical protein ACERZ8_09865 [Tateyamaria armeniaca]|uniref:Uncharacterized protein n=1 Tax=Tateyamaria armeniaca TaxID=2518930 RepID=A0ABW8UTA2_9RHOB
MKSLIRRVHAMLQPSKTSGPDVEAATPLVHLLDEVEPAPDLFARIEARLDGEKASRLPHVSKVLFVSFTSGLAIGALVIWAGQDRQSIVARPTTDAAWVPLGAVTLHGAGLRAFVRAKCHGHTHFYITIHGQSGAGTTGHTGDDIPLMQDEEKIRMECIF